jgi:WD40 repeat protein
MVQGLAFSPDSRNLVTATSNSAPVAKVSDGSSLRVWDAKALSEVQRLGTHALGLLAVAISADGRKVVSAGNTIRGGKLQGGHSVSMTIHRDGAAPPPGVEAFDKETLLARIATDPRSSVTDSLKRIAGSMRESDRVSYAVEDEAVEGGAPAKTLRMWGLPSGTEATRFNHEGWVNAAAFAPRGGEVFSFGFNGVIAWDSVSGQALRRLGQDVAGSANCGALSPDGRLVAIGTGGKDEPGAPYENCFVRLLTADNFSEIGRWPFRTPVTALAFSPDGRALLAGCEWGELRLLPTSA